MRNRITNRTVVQPSLSASRTVRTDRPDSSHTADAEAPHDVGTAPTITPARSFAIHRGTGGAPLRASASEGIDTRPQAAHG